MSHRASGIERDIATAIVFGLVTILVYWRAFLTGFTADDFHILARVKALDGIRDPLAYFSFGFFDYYRPIGFLSHALDWTLWGPNATAFHATNVVLHTVNGVLVFVIARRLFGGLAASFAMLLFAFDASNQEAVYWVAARFDLLASLFVLLALVLLWSDRPRVYWTAVACYTVALLCKESALSLLVMAAALDVFVKRRNVRDVLRRLVPLIAATIACVALREAATDVLIAGGERRLPKIAMLGAVLAGLVWTARTGGLRSIQERLGRRPLVAIGMAAGTTALAGLALMLPATASWTREKLGFVTFAANYSVSPLVTVGPPPAWYLPQVTAEAIPGLVILGLTLALLARLVVRVRNHERLGFVLCLIAGALLPVFSMTAGTRYLYLSSPGVALAGAWACQAAMATRWRAVVSLVIPLVGVLGITQIFDKGRDWRWASDLTRQGIAEMSARLAPCGTRDVVMLTAPAGIRDVYSNLPWEAFDILHGCAPASFRTLLRVARVDAEVVVTDRIEGGLEMRVSSYQGQIVASEDLSRFDRPIAPGDRAVLLTPLGPLETLPDGDAQLFRLRVADEAKGVQFYYYSLGRIHTK